jgi:hypothetical protein
MKTRKKKQLTLYDVRKRRHFLIRRKRKSLTYRIGRVIRNSSLPRGKWPRSAQVDIRIAGMTADAVAALFAVATCIRIFNKIIKGKE